MRNTSGELAIFATIVADKRTNSFASRGIYETFSAPSNRTLLFLSLPCHLESSGEISSRRSNFPCESLVRSRYCNRCLPVRRYSSRTLSRERAGAVRGGFGNLNKGVPPSRNIRHWRRWCSRFELSPAIFRRASRSCPGNPVSQSVAWKSASKRRDAVETGSIVFEERKRGWTFLNSEKLYLPFNLD